MNNEIVKFPKPSQRQPNNDDGGQKRTFLDATRAVAKLSLLGRLDYERTRSKAAKELGCRVSFLDSVIENISDFRYDYTLRSFAREEGECLIDMYMDGTVIPSCLLARAKDAKTEERTDLLLLADGNFTLSRGVPHKEKP